MEKKLMRSRDDRWISGVLGGLANYLGVNALLLRIIYALATLLTGVFLGVLIYLLCIAFIPEEPRAPHVTLTDDDFYH